MDLLPEAAPLRQEMDDISSVPRQARPPKAHERCTETSNRARHFSRPSSVHQGDGRKEEARGDGLGNKLFGSRWRDAGSLGVAKLQCGTIE
jgi:hypothetical protein